MATDQRTLVSSFATNADFQSWVTGLIAQLTAVGLVQTADTGQINPATVSLPGTINTVAGYAIFRFNDALQATVPVYLEVEFGTGNALGRPSLWVTVGSGTNGAGTLTGQVSARKQPFGTSTAAAPSLSYCCSDGSGVALYTNASTVSQNFTTVVAVDRGRDGNGSPTSDGVYFFVAAASISGWVQAIPAAGTIPSGAATSIGSGTFSPFFNAVNLAFGAHSLGGSILVAPIMYGLGKLLFSKMLHVLASADNPGFGTTVTVQTLGGNHTYLSIGSYSSPSQPSNPPSDVVMMLWE